MFYGAICLLIGRWWFKKSGYKTSVGIIYPFIAMFAALLLMISPISQFLLWLGPIFQKGQPIEWVMLAFHLLVPTLLLKFFWRGRNLRPINQNDLPIFVFPTVLHAMDIIFMLVGGYSEILWIVILASLLQTAFLWFYWCKGRKITI